MASQVDIANMALSDIGEEGSIVSLDEDTVEARRCKTFYTEALKSTLEDSDWSFARRQVELSLSGTAPTGWTYSYAYPANTVRVREIIQADRTEDRIPFDIFTDENRNSKFIVTDQETASAWVTSLIDATEIFTSSFVNALHYKLASMIAIPITRSADIKKAMEQQYLSAIAKASANDKREKQMDKPRDTDWIRARA